MYTGHALDIKRFITIEDITNGFAWWVPYMKSLEITMVKNFIFLFKG